MAQKQLTDASHYFEASICLLTSVLAVQVKSNTEQFPRGGNLAIVDRAPPRSLLHRCLADHWPGAAALCFHEHVDHQVEDILCTPTIIFSWLAARQQLGTSCTACPTSSRSCCSSSSATTPPGSPAATVRSSPSSSLQLKSPRSSSCHASRAGRLRCGAGFPSPGLHGHLLPHGKVLLLCSRRPWKQSTLFSVDATLGTIDTRWLAIVVLGGLRGPGTYGETQLFRLWLILYLASAWLGLCPQSRCWGRSRGLQREPLQIGHQHCHTLHSSVPRGPDTSRTGSRLCEEIICSRRYWLGLSEKRVSQIWPRADSSSWPPGILFAFSSFSYSIYLHTYLCPQVCRRRSRRSDWRVSQRPRQLPRSLHRQPWTSPLQVLW